LLFKTNNAVKQPFVLCGLGNRQMGPPPSWPSIARTKPQYAIDFCVLCILAVWVYSVVYFAFTAYICQCQSWWV